MVFYILKILLLFCFSLTISWFYYLVFSFHLENFDWYFPYIIFIFVIYAWIKFLQVSSWNKNISFTPFTILCYFFLHLFLLSCLFFHFNDKQVSDWIILFFKILSFSFFPIIIVFTTTAFWKKFIWAIFTRFFKNSFLFDKEQSVFRFILSLGFWFFIFIFLLTILWILWFYNLFSVFFLLLFFLALSYKEFFSFLEGFFNYKIFLPNHDFKSKNFINKISLPLVSSEFLFILASLVISVNLINIVRPMPIGWDDLGVYMNHPRILAWAWEFLPLGSMFSWETFTWIWYMFNSATQAFFLNNIWGVISFIVLTLIFSDLFKSNKKSLINIPLLLSTTFISMPMVIFQQAKDMKLDIGLFFISVVAVYCLYKIILNRHNEQKKDEKTILWWGLLIVFLIWALCWFAFSIKVTSLILISSLIWVLFYSRLWILGFLWYLSLFFGIFTKAWLWDYMNVVYPKDDLELRNKFFYFCIVLWFSFLAFSLRNNFKFIKKILLEFSIFIFWILIALIPWFWKNISEGYPNISVSTIISWKADRFIPDYSKLYSKNELESIEKNKISKNVTSSWVSSNEDFWRYFWYEKWINNYMKLPWNLTMQVNQRGEFTDIWFLFLALLPGILIFLPFKNNYFYIWILLLLFLEILVFIVPNTSIFFTNLFNNINLPEGYLFIFSCFLLPVVFFIFGLKKNESFIQLFKINLVFSSFYVFLWSIAAFWIVWYGIVMYFSFLLMIWVWLYYISSYEENYDFKNLFIKFSGSVIVFFIFIIYFFNSVFPHSFANLKNANYPYYKSNKITSDEGVFLYKKDYISILFELNIRKDKRKELILNSIESPEIKKLIKKQNSFDIKEVVSLLKTIESWKNIPIQTKSLAKRSKLKLYSSILSPSSEFINKEKIYRIGTFLKYFIVENNNRLLEDNLIFNYDSYIYDENSIENTVYRMKKIWFKYLLVDLNAATIDKDSRRNLTRRYENLLKTFTSDKLELIDTDSICLKIALEDYNNSSKTDEDLKNYIYLAWVNYNNFSWEKLLVSRNNKILNCYNYILKIISKDKISKTNYNYLLSLKNYINTNKISNKEDLYKLLSWNINQWFKVLFKIKD